MVSGVHSPRWLAVVDLCVSSFASNCPHLHRFVSSTILPFPSPRPWDQQIWKPTGMLLIGIKDSSKINIALTILNFGIISFVIIFGAFFVEPSNWSPFSPYGNHGIFQGAGTVFFSFIGLSFLSLTHAHTHTRISLTFQSESTIQDLILSQLLQAKWRTPLSICPLGSLELWELPQHFTLECLLCLQEWSNTLKSISIPPSPMFGLSHFLQFAFLLLIVNKGLYSSRPKLGIRSG